MSYQSPTETGAAPASQIEVHGSVIRFAVDAPELDTMAYAPMDATTGQREVPLNRANRRREAGSRGDKVVPPAKKTNDLIAKKEHISRVLRNCREILNDIVETDDLIQASNWAHSLSQEFKSLWQFRDARENEWADLVNLLQIALPSQRYEDIPKESWIVISRIFSECLVDRTIRNDDTHRAIRLLKEAKLDPWCGISGPTADSV